jgi:hypothetical protein
MGQTFDIVVRLRLEEPSDELLASAADEIELLRDGLMGVVADREKALRQLEETVRVLIWIANGGEGAGEDGLRYVAGMAVEEAGA